MGNLNILIYISIIFFGFSFWVVYLRKKPVLILGLVLISELILPKIKLPFGTMVTISDVILPLQAFYSIVFIRDQTKRKKWFLRFAVLFILMGIAIFLSINIAIISDKNVVINDWFDIIKVIRYFSTFIVAYYIVKSKDAFRKLGNFFILCTIFACILGWGQVFEVPVAQKLVPLYDTARDSPARAISLASRRAIGTMWNPNIFGSFINLANALLVGRILGVTRKVTRKRLFELLFLVFFVLTLFQTASRTNLIATVIIIFVTITIVNSQKNIQFRYRIIRPLSFLQAGFITIILIFIFYIMGKITTDSSAWSRIVKNVNIQEIITLNDRTIAWGETIYLIFQSPSSILFGHGPGLNYIYLFTDNEYLRMWLRLGIFSLLIYIALIIYVWKMASIGIRLSKSSANDRVIFLSLIGMLVVWGISAIAGPFYWINPLMTTFMIFTGVATRRVDELLYG